MDFTVELAKAFNKSPFDVLSEEKDKVIMLINYFIEKGNADTNETKNNREAKNKNEQTRIRVNDKTATGGWF